METTFRKCGENSIMGDLTEEQKYFVDRVKLFADSFCAATGGKINGDIVCKQYKDPKLEVTINTIQSIKNGMSPADAITFGNLFKNWFAAFYTPTYYASHGPIFIDKTSGVRGGVSIIANLER
jgi:hypothetical protein